MSAEPTTEAILSEICRPDLFRRWLQTTDREHFAFNWGGQNPLGLYLLAVVQRGVFWWNYHGYMPPWVGHFGRIFCKLYGPGDMVPTGEVIAVLNMAVLCEQGDARTAELAKGVVP